MAHQSPTPPLTRVDWINPGRPPEADSGNAPNIQYLERDTINFANIDNTQPPTDIETHQIILNRHTFMMHITSEVLLHHNRERYLSALAGLMGSAASMVKSRQNRNFIDRICIERHLEMDAIMIRFIGYVEQMQDLEYACQEAQRIFREIITGTRTGISDIANLSSQQYNSIERLITESSQNTTAYSGTAMFASGAYGYNQHSQTTFIDNKAEKKALKLLKSMITDKEFKTYEQKGIIDIKGKSGRRYTIQKHGMIKVYNRWNKFLYKLCIESKTAVPSTDQVIARMKLALSDEKRLHKLASKFESG